MISFKGKELVPSVLFCLDEGGNNIEHISYGVSTEDNKRKQGFEFGIWTHEEEPLWYLDFSDLSMELEGYEFFPYNEEEVNDLLNELNFSMIKNFVFDMNIRRRNKCELRRGMLDLFNLLNEKMSSYCLSVQDVTPYFRKNLEVIMHYGYKSDKDYTCKIKDL